VTGDGRSFGGLRHVSISELKHVPEPARRIEVFTGQGRRRTWTAADKLEIVAESYHPGASVCAWRACTA